MDWHRAVPTLGGKTESTDVARLTELQKLGKAIYEQCKQINKKGKKKDSPPWPDIFNKWEGL